MAACLIKQRLMYRIFGKKPEKRCGDCKNLVIVQRGQRKIPKCSVYGVSGCAATDWAMRWEACNMFNREHLGGRLVTLTRLKPEDDHEA